MNISLLKRSKTVYKILKNNFGLWFSPLITGTILSVLRILIIISMKIDKIFYPKIKNYQIKNNVIIVGNPRSGTTFLHRFLINNNIGTGGQLWKLLYPSICIQKILKPFLPILEKISPTRHHATVAHKTSLQSIETDDASIFFRFFDGFFLYGFLLSWADEDLFHWVDPKQRNTSKRDYKWLNEIWKRILIDENQDRYIGKLFSISANTPEFLEKNPEAKILYIIRDPIQVIPSGLSLVTGVLDKRFGFWSLPKDKRQKFINRLYKALIELQIRFTEDWKNDKIDKKRVMLVHFKDIMQNFDSLMIKILKFLNHDISKHLEKEIIQTAKSQKQFKSKHKYDLEKFGLSSKEIKEDSKLIYETFFK